MSYHSTGYFGNADQVQAINQSLKATAKASPEQLWPPLQPVNFQELGMYTFKGKSPLVLNSQIAAVFEKSQASVVTLPIIGVVKKTHLYIGLAAVAGLIVLKKMKKI